MLPSARLFNDGFPFARQEAVQSRASRDNRDMESKTTLAQEAVWFVLSVVVLVVFVPTALLTATSPADWTGGFVDFSTWQAEPPTWSLFGMNVLLVLVAAVLAFFSAALLIRRVNGSRR